MAKLNFNEQRDISFLIPGGEEPLVIPVEKAYSWAKIVATQTFLDMTCDTIRKWYWSVKNLEGVIDGFVILWKHIKDGVGEFFLDDFINQKEFAYKKEMLTANFDNVYGSMWNSAFDEIKAIWGGLSIDQTSRQMYRAIRKEARGRVTGIGFGFSGGVKAAAGAGLANIASGMAHGAFNAIGNAVDSISTNSKMNEFYNQPSTLEGIIDTWTSIFWHMYNNHIKMVNDILVEEGTPGYYDFSQMMSFQDSAQTIWDNMQKADNLSAMDIMSGELQCIEQFPFEPEYWKKFLNLLIIVEGGNKKTLSVIYDFAAEMDRYVPSFYDEIASELIESMIISYISQKVEDNSFSGQDIIGQLLEKSSDESFDDVLVSVITNIFMDEDNGMDQIAALKGLMGKINKEFSRYFYSSEFAGTYEHKMNNIAISFLHTNIETVIQPVLFSSGIDSAITIIKNVPLIEPERMLNLIISIVLIYARNHKLEAGNEIFDNLDRVKTALNITSDLNENEKYRALRLFFMPIEQKVSLFQKFFQGIIHENGIEIFGKNSNWGNIPQARKNKIKENFPIANDEEILFFFDNTLTGSGKKGVVLTQKKLIFIDDFHSESIEWSDLVNNRHITYYDSEFFIEMNEDGKKGITSFTSVRSISMQALMSLITGVCSIFAGEKPVIKNFTPIEGAEFDVSKLEKTESINSGSSFVENKEPVLAATVIKSEERFNYLRADDRIYTALKFKERKGFFRHILPASWILTIGFYGLAAFVLLMIAALVIPSESDTAKVILGLIFLLVVPIALLVFGIKNRVKYIKEKKNWKDCTDSGKRDIKEVFKEFQEMEKEYLGI
jgi:hypothetical protein